MFGTVSEFESVRHHPFNRGVLDADNFDVGTKERLQKTCFQGHAVGSEAVVLRDQDIAEPRVLEPRAHFLANELRDLFAHLGIEEELHEGRDPELERTVLVDLLQHGAAPLRRLRSPLVLEVERKAAERVRHLLSDPVELRFVRRLICWREFWVPHRYYVLRSSDEHRQVTGLV